MFRSLVLAAAALALAVAPGQAAAQLLINGIPPGNAVWAADQDVVLDSAGNATWTFKPDNLPPDVPSLGHMPGAMDTVNPIVCNWTARTRLAVTVHCWRSSTTGLLSGLFAGTVTGAQVTLIARVFR